MSAFVTLAVLIRTLAAISKETNGQIMFITAQPDEENAYKVLNELDYSQQKRTK